MPDRRSIQRMLTKAGKRLLTICTAPLPASGVRVIGYHSISNGRSPLCVAPEDFDYQLDYLTRNGFKTLSIDEYVSRVMGGVKSCKEVLITFDDGYVDFIDNAIPILKKYNCRATVFVATNLVGTRPTWIERDHELILKVLNSVGFNEAEKQELLRWNEAFAHAPLMDWDQLRQIQRQGIDVQSHSADHHFLTHLPADLLAHDLKQSREMLESQLNARVRGIAYPYGDCNPQVASAALQAGYDVGFLSLPSAADDRLQIGRTQIGGDDLRANFRFTLSAANGYTASVRRVLARLGGRHGS